MSANAQDLRSIAQSPFRIQTYVRTQKAFNAGDLWKTLGLPEPARSFDCEQESPCVTWLQPVQLSSSSTPLVALRFSQPAAQLDRYVVFQQNESGWKVVGHIDCGDTKYFDPILFPEELGGRWWLVLRDQSGSGTGFYSSTQRWFELKNGHLREVLSILGDAYILGYPGGYVLRPAAIVTDFQRSADGELVRVLYRLAFALVTDDGVDDGSFGSIEAHAIYRRRGDEVSFHLDASEGVDANDIARIFLPDEASPTEFLRDDLQNLLKIARGPKSRERQWLEENLKDFPKCAEKQQLMQALVSGAHQ